MNDPGGMSLGQCIRHLHGIVQHLVHGQSFGRNKLVQRFARHVFHRDEPYAFVLAHLIHGANIRVVQGGSRAGFSLKPLQRARVKSITCRTSRFTSTGTSTNCGSRWR